MMSDHITGRRAVLEAFKANRTIQRLLVAENTKGSVQDILKIARKRGIPLERLPKSKLDLLVGDVQHQGIVALVEAREYVEPEDILAIAKDRNESPLVVLLDGVEDPQNLGAIIRTCEAAGAHGLIIPKRRSASLSAGAVKASVGASEHLAISRVVNLVRTIDFLKESGIWVIGTDPEASTCIWEADFTVPLGIVLGGEHKGLGRLVKENCDFTLTIPMKGHVGSLNVSASTAVVLYEVMRQRRHAILDS